MKTYFKKPIITVITCIFAILLIGEYKLPTAYAAGEGWIEVKVNVPENFSDQIYVQFQEEGKFEEAFYDNFVQILPENEYVGRIKLQAGTYEITCKNTYENPLIYYLELADNTDYPIVVEAGSTAASVEMNCKVVPIEELPEIEGEYPQEILEAAQRASDEKAKAEVETDVESEENVVSESISSVDETEDIDINERDPLNNILRGLLSTILFISIIGGIGYIFYRSKENRE